MPSAPPPPSPLPCRPALANAYKNKNINNDNNDNNDKNDKNNKNNNWIHSHHSLSAGRERQL